MIETRSGCPIEQNQGVSNGFEQSCNKCHATCGQCHVSRPEAVHGGFIDSHIFNRTPDMINQCTACHGSRIGEEYRGSHSEEIPGYKSDVHYRKSFSMGGRQCMNCHTKIEMHTASADYRYAVTEMPRCEDCHSGAAFDTANAYHDQHLGKLSCHVCHAQDYKGCNTCHVSSGRITGSSYLEFKIGKNPLPDERSYEYATLRHIPISPDTYEGWGGDTPNFNILPTWKYTTPHNIDRWTSRTYPDTIGGQTCGSVANTCHTSTATVEGFFLREVDLTEIVSVTGFQEEYDANLPYMVPDSPPEEWGN